MENLKRNQVKITIAVFIVGICISCILWLYKPGMHFMPGFMHIDVKENCYVYDLEQGKFTGKTDVIIKGRGNDITKKFTGEISVDNYEIQGNPINPTAAGQKESVWYTSYTGITGSVEKDENGEEAWKSEFSRYSYFLQVNAEDSDKFIITILDGETNKNYYAIYAESEEKAWELLQSMILKDSAI